MKKILVFCFCVVLSTVSARAEWEIGAHGCGLLGGGLKGRDIPGFGAQLVYVANYIYSLEIAVSRYKATDNGKDGGKDEDLNITALAATMRVHASPVNERLGFYGGVGAGVFMMDFSGAREDQDDNKIRPLAAIGARFGVTDNVLLFAEYRYMLKDLRFQDDFDHGLARIGAAYSF